MSTLERLVGTVLGGYRLERVIGSGGMGAVFEATQLSLSRRVAVKVMKPAFEHTDDRIKRFEIETDAIARLQHPHIVHVIDAGRADDGTLFLAMELLEGQTVRQLIRQGRLPWQRALTIGEGIASALVAAHAAGVIHRDLKAENAIVWEKAGRPDFVKVLDFGVAKLTSRYEAPAVTGTGFVAGTPGYMSPEQILGRGDDPRADLYSLGVLLFEMLTGRAPFVAHNSMELMLLHLNETAPRVSAMLVGTDANVPAAVDALVAGLLSKDASLRPPDAQALVDALRNLRESTANTVPDLRTPSAPSSVPSFLGETIGSKVIASPVGGPPAAAAVSTPLPQAAAVAPAVETSPTVARPLPAEASIRPKRTRLIAAALGVVVVGAAVSAGFYRSAYTSSVFSTKPEAFAHIERAVEAYWELDLPRVLDETELALAIDQDAAWAHVLRSQVILLRAEPFALADRALALAKEAADRRFERSMMFKVTHLQHEVGILHAFDSADAQRRFDAHPQLHSCDDSLERQLFAVKMLTANQDPDTVEKLFRAVTGEDTQSAPATVLGLARVARKRGRLDEARTLLNEARARSKAPLLLQELVEVELMAGNRAAAIAHLEELAKRDRSDARVQIQLAALAPARDAFAPLVTELRRLKPEDPARIDGLAAVGERLASLGRMKEADALWVDAFEGATKESPDLATEVASIVIFFSILNDDYTRGAQWYERVKDWAPRCENELTRARTRMFSLAASFLLSRFNAKMPSEVDFKILQGAKRDIPLVMQQIEFSRALWSGKLDEAAAVTERMPACLRSTYLGLVGRSRAAGTTDPALKRKALEEAAAHFDAATTPDRIAFCASGADIFSWLQSIVVGMSYAQRARMAHALEDREGAQAAIAGFRAHWPAADPDGVNARDIAAVEAWLGSGATVRGLAGDLTERAVPRKNPRREGP